MFSYLAKLPKELDEGAFTKRVGQAGMKSQSGILLGQNSHPSFLFTRKYIRETVTKYPMLKID